MTLVETFLFIMILVMLINGLIFFRMFIKLQKKNNELLKKLIEQEINHSYKDGDAMPHSEIEKLKTKFMSQPYERKK